MVQELIETINDMKLKELWDINYVHKVRNKDIDTLYSIGKYSHYFIITLNGV